MKLETILSFKKKYFLFFILIIGGVLFSFLPSIKFLINFAHDDSFFYLKTSYNFSKGNGSTFDQVNVTNGYQPLWFLILSLYFFVINIFINFSPEIYFRFVVLLHVLISIATLIIVYKIFKIQKDSSNYTEQFILFLPLFFILVFIRDFGIESQLTCFLFSIYCYFKSKELIEEKNYLTLKIILLNLIFLARIDYLVSVVPAIVISDYLTAEKNNRRKFLSNLFTALLIVSSIYFLFNKFYFDHFISISATIKNSFPELILIQNLKFLTFYLPYAMALAKLVFIIIILLFFYKKNLSEERIEKFLFGSCIGVFLFIIINLCFNLQALREWYLTFPTFVASLLLLYSLNFIKRFFILKLTILIFTFVLYFYFTRVVNSKWDSSYEYALSLKNVTTQKDKIFQIDYSGVVGFFSERKLINGDGLINSFEYRDYLKKNSLEKYFKDKNINLYSTHSEVKKHNLIIDSSSNYIDELYSNKVGDYSFKFSSNNLVFKMPFDYNHTLYKATGDWYLFKIEN